MDNKIHIKLQDNQSFDKAYEFGKKLGLPLVESDKNEAALALRRTYRRYNS